MITPRKLVIAAVITVVTLIAAIVAVSRQPGLSTAAAVNEAAFPELRRRPEAVTRVTVTHGGEPIVLERRADGRWVSADGSGSGYPAAAERIRELVQGLAEMRLIAAKTARPDRFARLEVEDPGPDAAARRLRLDAADGAPLADAVIGRRLFAVTGDRDAGTYIRRSGDDRAWLASGAVTVATKRADWLDRAVIDLGSDRVRRVEVLPAAGDAYAVTRPTPDAEFVLTPVPEGVEGKTPQIRGLASILTAVEFTDVMQADRLPADAPTAQAKVTTFDGLEIVVRAVDVANDRWATLDARAASAASDPATAAAAAEAERLTGRWRGWAFKLPSHVAERLTPPRSDLVGGAADPEKPS